MTLNAHALARLQAALELAEEGPRDRDGYLTPEGRAHVEAALGHPGGDGEAHDWAAMSEADWASFAAASAARSVGEKWQGPSGKWFTKRPDGRVVPTAAPDAGGKGKPGRPAPKQPTKAELARQKREAAAKEKAEAKAKAEREKAQAAAREKAQQERVVTAIGEMVRGERKPTAVAVRQAGEVLLTMKADQLKALAAELGTRKSGAKQALVDAVLARAKAGAGKPTPKPATPPGPRAAPKSKLPPLDLPEVPPLPKMPDPSGAKLPPPAQVPDGPAGERLRAAPHLHEAARQMAALHERGEALRAGESRLWAQAAVLGRQAQAEFAAAGAARRVTAASKERSERGKQLLARSGELRQRALEFRAALDGHARQCRDHLHAVAGVPPGLRAGIGDHDFDASSDPVRPAVDGATAFLTPLLGQGAAQQHLPGFRVTVRADDARPHYQNRDRSINGGTKDLRPEIAAHEMAHGIEYGMAGAQAACNEFLEHRLKGERPAELRSLPGGEKYDPGEKGAKDDFDRYFAGTSAYYVGKRYSSGATEVLSMGAQALYEDPAKFAAKDPEYFAFTLGVLRGELRSGRRHLPDDDEISLSPRR